MAVRSKEENQQLFLTIDNGDLSKLQMIMEKWSFKDYQSLIRFFTSVLLVTENKFISIKTNGIQNEVQPAAELLQSPGELNDPSN